MHHVNVRKNGHMSDSILIPMTWGFISTYFHLPKLQSKRIWKAVHAELSQTATIPYSLRKMVLYAEHVHISMHHAASCSMRSEVKTYEDPNSRIVLAPHEPIFLRIRQEKFHGEHVDLVRNDVKIVRRIWTTESMEFSFLHCLSWPFCRIDVGFLRVCTWRV